MDLAMLYSGMEIVPTESAVDRIYVQNKQHKKKRINKKWLKRYGTRIILVPSTKVFIMGNKIIAHPSIIEKIKKSIT